jgi:hypothetical protein
MQSSEIRPLIPKAGARATRPGRSRHAANAHKRTEVARYISEITSELSKIAGGASMPMLVYFLNLARVEAETVARETDTPEKPSDQ